MHGSLFVVRGCVDEGVEEEGKGERLPGVFLGVDEVHNGCLIVVCV